MSTSPKAEKVNPYAPPGTLIGDFEPIDAGDLAEAEEVRRTYLGHEASIKSLGMIHHVAAFLFVIAAFSLLSVLAVRTPAESDAVTALAVGMGVSLVLGALNLALGAGLQGLRPWARRTEMILVAIALANSLLGAVLVASSSLNWDASTVAAIVACLAIGLIPGYVLHLLRSTRGAMVFSREYREIIERTPHIKYETSLALVFVLAIIVLLLTFIMAIAIVNVRAS
jgi:hypothetical protein